jgi:hypothetical protein
MSFDQKSGHHMARMHATCKLAAATEKPRSAHVSLFQSAAQWRNPRGSARQTLIAMMRGTQPGLAQMALKSGMASMGLMRWTWHCLKLQREKQEEG